MDRLGEPYHASVDGNEQYEDADSVLVLLKKIERLERLSSSIVFIEQPIKRQNALDTKMSVSLSRLAAQKPVIIDESDDSLDAFPRARALGYTGVSSKTCKGLYKSLINAARCLQWNRESGVARDFMMVQHLTIRARLALRLNLTLVSRLWP